MSQKYFRHQEKDEKVELLLRRHWMHFAAPIVFLVILFFIPILLLSAVNSYLPFLLEAPFLKLVILILVYYFLFLWLYFFVIWTDYYLDTWIITDRRILDIEQLGLFSREVSEFKIFRVQDVTVEVRGILPTLLNYGDVHVQTAGEARKFIFRQVPNPHQAKQLILKLHTQAYQKQLKENL